MDQTLIKKGIHETGIIFKQIKKDRQFRQELAKQSHYWFFKIYMGHHIIYPLAFFHKQMLAITECSSYKLVGIMGFRESGKTTIMNTSYILWSIIGRLQKKFILIISRSKKQAKIHLENIKYELEYNESLKNDSGPLIMEKNDSGSSHIFLKKFGAKIMTIGMNQQAIRGLKHNQYRPDLIICEDFEDGQSVKNFKETKRICEWFKNEVMPSGSKSSNIVVLGNFLNEFSFIMKLRKEIRQNRIADAAFCVYPLLDDYDKNLWPEKFTPEDIEKLRKSQSDELVWAREYLLLPYPKSFRYVSHDTYEKYFGKNKNEGNTKNSEIEYCINAPKYEVFCGPNKEIITTKEWNNLSYREKIEVAYSTSYQGDKLVEKMKNVPLNP